MHDHNKVMLVLERIIRKKIIRSMVFYFSLVFFADMKDANLSEPFRRSKPLKLSIEEKPWLTLALCVFFWFVFCGYIFKSRVAFKVICKLSLLCASMFIVTYCTSLSFCTCVSILVFEENVGFLIG